MRYERVGYDIYRTISGYVTGNLLISLVAGVTSALGLLVGILDLIPLAGATLAAIIVSTVVLLETNWIRAIIVIGFFLEFASAPAPDQAPPRAYRRDQSVDAGASRRRRRHVLATGLGGTETVLWQTRMKP